MLRTVLGLWLLAGCAGGLSVVDQVDLPACDAPVEGPEYDDLAAGSGVDFVHDADVVPPDSLSEEAARWLFDLGGAVAAADFDQDGHDDVFFGQTGGASALYWGRGDGTFEVGDPFDEPTPSLVTAASAADFDGDGRLDLAVGAVDRVALFHQAADRRFVEVSDQVGLSQKPGMVTALPWADPDGDGDLDLFVARYALGGELFEGGVYSAKAQLWRNEIGGFTSQTAELSYPGGDGGATLLARWADLDDDGDVDLLQSNDFGSVQVNSFLHENRGGFDFWDRLPDSGLPLIESPRGVAVRDLDGDGGVDLWFAGVGSHAVYSSTGEWAWENASLEWPAGVPADLGLHSWSVLDVDVDGDGVPGLFVTYGPEYTLPGIEGTPPGSRQDDLFLAPAGGGWTPADALPESRSGNSRGAALADFDGDGVPDLAVGRLGGAPGLYAGRCTENARLVVRLRDRTGYNQFGVGARVTVEAGGRVQAQEVVAGGRGVFSGGTPDLFFGLGSSGSVDALTVRWPDGVTEAIGAVCGGCVVTVDRRLAED